MILKIIPHNISESVIKLIMITINFIDLYKINSTDTKENRILGIFQSRITR